LRITAYKHQILSVQSVHEHGGIVLSPQEDHPEQPPEGYLTIDDDVIPSDDTQQPHGDTDGTAASNRASTADPHETTNQQPTYTIPPPLPPPLPAVSTPPVFHEEPKSPRGQLVFPKATLEDLDEEEEEDDLSDLPPAERARKQLERVMRKQLREKLKKEREAAERLAQKVQMNADDELGDDVFHVTFEPERPATMVTDALFEIKLTSSSSASHMVLAEPEYTGPPPPAPPPLPTLEQIYRGGAAVPLPPPLPMGSFNILAKSPYTETPSSSQSSSTPADALAERLQRHGSKALGLPMTDLMSELKKKQQKVRAPEVAPEPSSSYREETLSSPPPEPSRETMSPPPHAPFGQLRKVPPPVAPKPKTPGPPVAPKPKSSTSLLPATSSSPASVGPKSRSSAALISVTVTSPEPSAPATPASAVIPMRQTSSTTLLPPVPEVTKSNRVSRNLGICDVMLLV
jgi:hypothetical protein